MLFGFLRHVLREQRLGYPDDREPGDWDLLARDARGSPSLGSLFRDGAELAGYDDVPFRSRPNVVVTRMQAIVERHRRRGVICERGAHDLYRECERVLNALKSCERVTETPSTLISSSSNLSTVSAFAFQSMQRVVCTEPALSSDNLYWPAVIAAPVAFTVTV